MSKNSITFTHGEPEDLSTIRTPSGNVLLEDTEVPLLARSLAGEEGLVTAPAQQDITAFGCFGKKKPRTDPSSQPPPRDSDKKDEPKEKKDDEKKENEKPPPSCCGSTWLGGPSFGQKGGVPRWVPITLFAVVAFFVLLAYLLEEGPESYGDSWFSLINFPFIRMFNRRSGIFSRKPPMEPPAYSLYKDLNQLEKDTKENGLTKAFQIALEMQEWPAEITRQPRFQGVFDWEKFKASDKKDCQWPQLPLADIRNQLTLFHSRDKTHGSMKNIHNGARLQVPGPFARSCGTPGGLLFGDSASSAPGYVKIYEQYQKEFKKAKTPEDGSLGGSSEVTVVETHSPIEHELRVWAETYKQLESMGIPLLTDSKAGIHYGDQIKDEASIEKDRLDLLKQFEPGYTGYLTRQYCKVRLPRYGFLELPFDCQKYQQKKPHENRKDPDAVMPATIKSTVWVVEDVETELGYTPGKNPNWKIKSNKYKECKGKIGPKLNAILQKVKARDPSLTREELRIGLTFNTLIDDYLPKIGLYSGWIMEVDNGRERRGVSLGAMEEGAFDAEYDVDYEKATRIEERARAMGKSAKEAKAEREEYERKMEKRLKKRTADFRKKENDENEKSWREEASIVLFGRVNSNKNTDTYTNTKPDHWQLMVKEEQEKKYLKDEEDLALLNDHLVVEKSKIPVLNKALKIPEDGELKVGLSADLNIKKEVHGRCSYCVITDNGEIDSVPPVPKEDEVGKFAIFGKGNSCTNVLIDKNFFKHIPCSFPIQEGHKDTPLARMI